MRTVRDVVHTVLAGERREAALAITFLDKRRMRRLNAEYKHHDIPTDVNSGRDDHAGRNGGGCRRAELRAWCRPRLSHPDHPFG